MARKFARIDVTGVIRDLENIGIAARRARQDLQIELAQSGAEKMKELIETRGTGRSWTTPMLAKHVPRRGEYRDGSSPGRVNTGNMRDSVSYRFESGQQKVLSSFGWINANPNDEEYFMAQEYGFEEGGFRKPMRVDGMFALRDSRLYVSQVLLPRLVRKYEKRISKGKY